MTEALGARASIQDVRKAELIEATKRCIAERGLHGTTLRDIAQHAQTTASSALYYFASKEELILAAIADASDELRNDVERQLEQKSNPIEKLEAIVRTTLMSRGTATVSWRLWLEIRAQAVRESFVRATYVGKYEEWLTLVRRVIQEGIDSGDFSVTNAEATATMISAGIDGIAFYLLMNPSADREQAAEWCVDSLRTLVKVESSSQPSRTRMEIGKKPSKRRAT